MARLCSVQGTPPGSRLCQSRLSVTAVLSAPLVGKIYIHTHTRHLFAIWIRKKVGKVQTVALLDVIPIKRDVKTWHSYRLSVLTPDRLRDRFSLILFLCCCRASIWIKALDLPVYALFCVFSSLLLFMDCM